MLETENKRLKDDRANFFYMEETFTENEFEKIELEYELRELKHHKEYVEMIELGYELRELKHYEAYMKLQEKYEKDHEAYQKLPKNMLI